jgi:site-specific recombinase XerD
MILGRGSAQTDDAVIAEYAAFLPAATPVRTPVILQRLQGAPHVMQRRLGKPPSQWTDADILDLYATRQKATWYPYTAFLAFLFFRGYRRASLALLTALPCELSRYFRPALAPQRTRLQEAQQQLGYPVTPVGSQLTLLIWLLAISGKPLTELTRTDFEAFRRAYQTWYQTTQQRANAQPNARLFRLECCLVHWGVLPPARPIFRHEEHFARLRPPAIRSAIVTYLTWCDVRYQPSSIYSHRAALLNFFLWLQDGQPELTRLDQVTRTVAIDYAHHLQELVARQTYAPKYRNDLYHDVRLFFEFAIEEHLDTAPPHNPFSRRDTPRCPDPLPRYIPDPELRLILTYCREAASLQERTVVITLLHTGIRAAELASLKTSDLVQLQGKWQLHIHEGKGLKDRMIPLTAEALSVLQTWQANGREHSTDYLFARHGQSWGSNKVGTIVRQIGLHLDIAGLTPHRFRHSFAVALLNYGMRESALQKLMGHATLSMTLEYARILDRTVEQSFNQAVAQMQTGALGWVPSFFAPEDYTRFTEADSLNWIRLSLGFCRRHLKLNCESDVKCLLCDRFCILPNELPRLVEMRQRFLELGLQVKADVVAAHIQRLETHADQHSLFALVQPTPAI